MIYSKYSFIFELDDLKFENNWLFDDMHLFEISLVSPTTSALIIGFEYSINKVLLKLNSL